MLDPKSKKLNAVWLHPSHMDSQAFIHK